MPTVYGRELDLNLLRVFAVVAEVGSVTEAAGRLYVTQPAVSAALRRLNQAVGAPLFVRQGRSLVLTSRGQRLRQAVEVHLAPLVESVLDPGNFDPSTSTRTLRLGLSDAAELWLLPPLLRELGREAPGMSVIVLPIQFRTVGAALANGVNLAVSVADELPSSIRRCPLIEGGFVCLFDPRYGKIKKLTKAEYFAREHVIVSYNGDLRGVVEDMLGESRKVRCSVSSFAHVGAIVEGTALIATVPETVAEQICAVRPHLSTCAVPLPLSGAVVELLWPAATEDDGPCKFAREKVLSIARGFGRK
jgi:LysR family transcriptional regulator, mexEF-oprN operon transcriptional activator